VSPQKAPAQDPQSIAQLLQLSLPLHDPSPQYGQDPQSDEQFEQLSEPLHEPSPQLEVVVLLLLLLLSATGAAVAAGFTVAGQSLEQELELSPPLHDPSPHQVLAPQSDGQEAELSPAPVSHDPSPHELGVPGVQQDSHTVSTHEVFITSVLVVVHPLDNVHSGSQYLSLSLLQGVQVFVTSISHVRVISINEPTTIENPPFAVVLHVPGAASQYDASAQAAFV